MATLACGSAVFAVSRTIEPSVRNDEHRHRPDPHPTAQGPHRCGRARRDASRPASPAAPSYDRARAVLGGRRTRSQCRPLPSRREGLGAAGAGCWCERVRIVMSTGRFRSLTEQADGKGQDLRGGTRCCRGHVGGRLALRCGRRWVPARGRRAGPRRWYRCRADADRPAARRLVLLLRAGAGLGRPQARVRAARHERACHRQLSRPDVQRPAAHRDQQRSARGHHAAVRARPTCLLRLEHGCREPADHCRARGAVAAPTERTESGRRARRGDASHRARLPAQTLAPEN